MTSFPLKIITPDGVRFEGDAQELVVRTTTGDTGIMAGHINYAAPLGMGQTMIVTDGQKRYAACIGGMVSVVNGQATLLPITFEWSDQIDLDRAKSSEERAQNILADKTSSSADILLAQARLKRAMVRKNVASRK